MRLFECVMCCLGLAMAAEAQTGKSFPSDDEIQLLLTQAERAIQSSLGGSSADAPGMSLEEQAHGETLGSGSHARHRKKLSSGHGS
jgi:hypothetical protein